MSWILLGLLVKKKAFSCRWRISGFNLRLSLQASTVERIMKNLRLEITQLRRSLDESRYFFMELQLSVLFYIYDFVVELLRK